MQYMAVVIEDDSTLRLIYRQVLNTLGFEVQEATNGAEGLALLQTRAPNLIFLDMLMPLVNGKMVLEYIRSAPHLRGTVTVIATAQNLPTDLSLEGVEFIRKPIRPSDIRAFAALAIEKSVQGI